MTINSRMTVDIRGRIASLTLCRPDRGNAIDHAFGAELLDAAITLSTTSVLALIIKSSGPHFSFGGDLKEMAQAESSRSAYLLKLTSSIHTAVSHFAAAPFVIISAAVGACAGAGFGLVLASDLVIGGRSATFTPAFSAVGLTPDTGVSFHLPRVVGQRRAAELLLTNRTLNAGQALEWGILNRVVNDCDLLAEAERLAEQLAQGPAAALASTKRLLASSLPGFQDHLALESAAIARQGLNSEAREGIGAFLGKRRPQFAPMGES
jgi:2-(1,2-epoxy-1,2-dihydrophenyl)acetyl-CoA isomerase